MFQVRMEIKRHRTAPILCNELHAEFLSEVRLLDLVENPDPFQREISIWKQRFADVVTGKLLLLEHHHSAALLRKNRAGRGTGGSAADHNRVVVLNSRGVVFGDVR